LHDVALMGPELKLAYVARLLRTFALVFGIKSACDESPTYAGQQADSPAGLVAGLTEIAATPERRQDGSRAR
jgi:hypothetical protein